MLRYSFIFLLIALIAGLLATGEAMGTQAIIARFCFVTFSILVGVSVLIGLAERGDSRSTQ
jgi:uncharacterized membrane protein YtjA (UPF0391 family)